MKLKLFLHKFWPIIGIGGLVAILGIINFHPGTILTGGDNLHPEFDFGLNIKRSIFAVWQEYQSLGLLGGMGHASDLVRQIFLWILSLVFPMESLRYIWTFLSLFIGGVGTYYLISHVLLYLHSPINTIQENQPKDLQSNSKIIAFIGSLFYILNLSTIQAYYAPYEVFSSHFASLPWLLLSTIIFFTKPNHKNLFLFALILLLSTPAAYVPTLFVVYLLATTILGLCILPKTKKSLLTATKYYFVVFLINAFWLLPFLYFTFTNSGVNVDAKINQIATQDIFDRNKEFGDIATVMNLNGFWINNVEPNLQGEITHMLLPWRIHLANPIIIGIGYFFFFFLLFGVCLTLYYKKRLLYSFVFLFLFAFTMLATNTPPFSWVDTFLRDFIPLVNQVFRFPFTKFSILASLIYAVFFSIALFSLIFHLQKVRYRKVVQSSIFFVIALALIFYVFPAFKGHLFYERETISLPREYKEVFSFFKNQDPYTRIANFPQHTFWSWNFYDWGYSGSGFLWYGIKQPILDRAFDVWGKTSEQYYYEITQALYSKDPKNFENVLQKYQITWLLVDQNVISNSSPKSLFFEQLKEILQKIPNITQVKSFGDIDIYKTKLQDKPKDFVFAARSLPTINSYQWSTTDTAYESIGNYIASDKDSNYYYPFRSLFSQKNVKQKEFEIKEDKEYIYIWNKIDLNLDSASLIIPAYKDKESYIPTKLFSKSDIQGNTMIGLHIQTPEIYVNNKKIWGSSTDISIFTIPSNTVLSTKISINGNESLNINSTNIINTALLLNHENSIVMSNEESTIVKNYIISTDTLQNLLPKQQKISLSNLNKKGQLIVKIPKINDAYLGSEPTLNSFRPVQNCDLFRKGRAEGTINNSKITLSAYNATACTSMHFQNLPHTESYAFFTEGKHIKGRSLHAWVLNEDDKYSVYNNYLDANSKYLYSFIIPPMERYGRAYSIHFDSISIGEKTENEINRVALYYMPYKFATSLVVSRNEHQKSTKEQFLFNVSHPNESLYIVDNVKKTPSTLVLSQSFDKGWKAYEVISDKGKAKSWINNVFPFVFGRELKEHVLVNNWANGWVIDSEKLKVKSARPPASSLAGEVGREKLIVVFWPQYLEYLGFGILALTFIYLTYTTFRRKTVDIDNDNMVKF